MTAAAVTLALEGGAVVGSGIIGCLGPTLSSMLCSVDYCSCFTLPP
jgi:hypothetical protein